MKGAPLPRFELDLRSQQLRRAGTPVALRPRTFSVLQYLAQRPGELVTKQELLGSVWAGLFVTDEVLTVCVSELRKALGDARKPPQFIETVPRRGYRFIAREGERWILTGSTPGSTPAARLPGDEASPFTPLVGRDAELAQLDACFTRALGGERQVVFVSGDPGIGKTALVDAFVRRLERGAGAGVWTLRGQCVESYGPSEPYLPVLEAFGRLAGQPERRHVVDLLRAHAPSWLLQLPGLLETTERQALQRDHRSVTRERMLRELSVGAELITTETPLVLVLEDLHWSDPSTTDLIAALAHRRQPARVLLLCTYRPIDTILTGHPLRAVVQELGRKQLCAELALEMLTEADVGIYLAARAGERAVPPTVVRLVHEHSAGNPLFMVTIADHFLGSVASVAVAELERRIPTSLQPMIARQLKTLTPKERALLDAASVVGAEFSVAAAAAGARESLADSDAGCTELAQRTVLRPLGMVEWPDGTVSARFAFRHALYQQVLYESLPAARRTGLHQRIGERLEAAFRVYTDAVAGELAMHFERAADATRAARYHRLAARAAVRRHALPEAVAHLDAALAAVAEVADAATRDREELETLVALVPLHMHARGHASAEVDRLCTRALALCERIGSDAQLALILAGIELSRRAQGDLEAATAAAQRLVAIAERTDDHALRVDAHHVMGTNRFWVAEFAAARQHLEQVVTLAQGQPGAAPLSHHDPEVCSRGYLATLAWLSGFPDRSAQACTAAIAAARACSHQPSRALGLVIAAWSAILRRDTQQVAELTQAALALANDYALPVWDSIATMLQGWALVHDGTVDEGFAKLQSGFAAYAAVQPTASAVDYQMLLADACLRSGRAADGLAIIEAAFHAQQHYQIGYFEPELKRLKGALLLASVERLDGPSASVQAGQAEICFQQAIEIARRRGAPALELRAAMSLARLWATQGRRLAAQRMLQELYGRFTEGFDTPDLRDAQQLIAELTR